MHNYTTTSSDQLTDILFEVLKSNQPGWADESDKEGSKEVEHQASGREGSKDAGSGEDKD